MNKVTGSDRCFQLTFDNGLTVSVAYHVNAYSDTDSAEVYVFYLDEGGDIGQAIPLEGPDAFDPDYEGFADVLGWQSPEQIAMILARVASIPRPENRR